MAAKYVLAKSSNDKFYFNLKAGNGEVILTSQMYTTKDAAKDGIASVQTNCTDDTRYERKKQSDGQPYFVLTAANGQTIGKSEAYSADSAMENGIASVKKNGTTTSIDDQA